MSYRSREESKWKVGDLVTLSSAGLRVDQNRDLTKVINGEKVPFGFGLVIKVLGGHERWPVRCHWFAGPQEFASFTDYELKRYRA